MSCSLSGERMGRKCVCPRVSFIARSAGRQLQRVLMVHFLDEPFRMRAAEAPEEAGVDQEFAQGGSNQSTEDDRGDRVENLTARLLPAIDERDQADAGGE